MSLRICILETDRLPTALSAQHHDFGWMTEQMFAKQPIAVECKVYNVLAGHYPPEDETWDAYFITGSRADSYAPDEWIQTLKAYILKLYAAGEVLIGICFGHQLLALTLGGNTELAKQGWGGGVHQYQVSKQYSWMTPALAKVNLLVSHQDQVTTLPEQAELILTNDFCTHAAYVIDNRVLGLQGHPEFTPEFAQALLALRKDHPKDSENYNRVMQSFVQTDNGQIVAQWIAQFVQAAKQAKQT